MDSTVAETSGFIVQTTDILALPDNDGCNILVNLEFRNGTWSLSRMPVSQDVKTSRGLDQYFLPFAAFSAKVEITLPNVSKLYNMSIRRSQRQARLVAVEGVDLVLMYFPSLVRSLSAVAFSEPARSIKLWARIS